MPSFALRRDRGGASCWGHALEAGGFKVNCPHPGFFRGRLLHWRAVPVLTLKYFRQARQRNGISLCLQRYTFALPHRRQDSSPSDQCTTSNHLRAAASSGTRFASSKSVIPFLCERPGFAMTSPIWFTLHTRPDAKWFQVSYIIPIQILIYRAGVVDVFTIIGNHKSRVIAARSRQPFRLGYHAPRTAPAFIRFGTRSCGSAAKAAR